MSLVAYDASDDEEGTSDEEIISTTPPPAQNKKLTLPAPKDTDPEFNLHLPIPKAPLSIAPLKEEDDEFLQKKATPTVKPPKGPVRITIPSLSEFKADELSHPKKPQSGPSKSTSLLKMLPTPKTEFQPPQKKEGGQPVRKVTSLVPDSVANRKKREGTVKKAAPTKPSLKALANHSDSEASDGESSDFFALAKEEKLPEVSSNEIALMVAKSAAKMAEAKSKFLEVSAATSEEVNEEEEPEEPLIGPSRNVEFDDQAIHVLVGGSKAKRAKLEDINVIELSSTDVLPSQEEFLRSYLQQQTQYIPTGRLEGYGSTNNKKSQITNLAAKALANEQELEAMWAASRQNRRAAGSKYGF